MNEVIHKAREQFAAEQRSPQEREFRNAVEAEKARLYERASRKPWWRRIAAAIWRTK